VNPLLATTDTTADRDRVEATSLVALLAARVAEAGDRPAVVDGLAAGQPVDGASAIAASWTWQELTAAAMRVAESLEAAGLRPGDRVAHVGPHSPDWLVVDLACLLGGLVHVAIHHDLPRTEQERLIGWLAPRGVIRSGPLAGLRTASGATRGEAGIRFHDVAAGRRGPVAASAIDIPGLAGPTDRRPAADSGPAADPGRRLAARPALRPAAPSTGCANIAGARQSGRPCARPP
jgi:hypothetical protein